MGGPMCQSVYVRQAQEQMCMNCTRASYTPLIRWRVVKFARTGMVSRLLLSKIVSTIQLRRPTVFMKVGTLDDVRIIWC
jgi:hypothetical protein